MIAKHSMSEQKAREIAISGLSYIAANEDETERFLALTGLTIDEMRNAASNPGFCLGVLDFFMGFEPALLKFAESIDHDPQDIVDARTILAGPEEAWEG